VETEHSQESTGMLAITAQDFVSCSSSYSLKLEFISQGKFHADFPENVYSVSTETGIQ
jgi:hypothetical protein